jgi:hypothetical protein
MGGKHMDTSERVVQGVSNLKSTDPLDLPPLYDSIDPEALGAVIDRMDEGEVVFTYAGTEVTVTADGVIDVEDGDASCRDAGAASVTN